MHVPTYIIKSALPDLSALAESCSVCLPKESDSVPFPLVQAELIKRLSFFT